MANYHSSVNMVSRGKGASLVRRVVYICGRNLFDDYRGLKCHSHRKDVVYSEVILPPGAPPEYADMQRLVTEMDRAEKRKDAQTAREIIFSLPVELSSTERTALACQCVREFWVSRGMCAIIGVHDAGKGNPHVHALLTTREVGQNGFSPKKNRAWNDRALYRQWREFLAEAQNREFERRGLDVRVSHESYAVQGIDRKPTHYLGPQATAMAKKGILTERAAENKAIQEEKKRQEHEHEKKKCTKRSAISSEKYKISAT